MSRNVIGLTIAACLAFSAAAMAQQSPTAPPADTIFLKSQQPGQYLARDRLIGLPVHNASGKIVGDIEDLIVGPEDRIEGVVIGTGGMLGVGEKRVGVTLSALEFSQKDGKTVVTLPSATNEVLDLLEPYKRTGPQRTLVERAQDKAQELTDKTRHTAGPAYEQAKQAAKEAYDKAMQAAKETYDKATEAEAPKQPDAPKQ